MTYRAEDSWLGVDELTKGLDSIFPKEATLTKSGFIRSTEEGPIEGYADYPSKWRDTRVVKADEIVSQAAWEMKDRAATRDNTGGQGERSMAATVATFNAYTGKNLTEEEGWAFMVILKLVRAKGGGYRTDDYVDGAAYFGLMGEAGAKTRYR